MPIAESPSYHGYDVSDERAVERDYGTVADLRAFLAAAHERGIAVITDLVLNHTSDQNRWFVDSAARTGHADWYVWSDTDPGYGGPDGQAVWHRAGNRYYYGLFGAGLPDLNLRSAAVMAEMQAVARYWLTDVGVDGFRLDAIKHLVEEGQEQVHTAATHDWLRAFRATVRAAKLDAFLVGEVFDLSAAAARYTPEDVDQVFEFGLAQATIDSIRRGDATALASAEIEDAGLFGAGETATFLTNHDQDRIASQLREDSAAEKLAATVLLTGGGTPFLYYGEEIGLTGQKPDERIRTPMPWDGSAPAAGFSTGTPWESLEEGWQTRNVAAQTADPGSLRSAYRDLIALRAGHRALAAGITTPLVASDPAIHAVIRATADEQIAILANVSDRAIDGATLDVDVGPICGPIRSAKVLYRSDGPSAPVVTITAPRTGSSGGFDDWAPIPSIPARTAFVIGLQP